MDPRYAWSLHGSYERGGEWDYDLQLKRPGDLPLRAGWLRAVAKGQARVRRGLHIGCPVLVLVSSHRGGDGEGFDESWFETDTVLDPASIRRQAKQLRGSVVVESVEGGMHDLFLSRLPVRDRVHARIAAWLQGIG